MRVIARYWGMSFRHARTLRERLAVIPSMLGVMYELRSFAYNDLVEFLGLVRGLVTVPGTRTYQAWYRNSASYCTVSTFNLSNGLEISWGA